MNAAHLVRGLFCFLVVPVLAVKVLDGPPKQSPEESWLWICEMYHKSEFVYEAKIIDLGCKMKCVVLTSSSNERENFFDDTKTYLHNLNDGIYCKRDHICNEGNCVLEYTGNTTDDSKMGVAVIEILGAEVPKKDTITASDTFVTVNIKGPEDIYVGKTDTVMDSNSPSFGKIFKTNSISVSSTIFMEVLDKDYLTENDYIATVYEPIRNILKEGKSGKEVTLAFPEGLLKVVITWLADE